VKTDVSQMYNYSIISYGWVGGGGLYLCIQ